MRILPVVAMLAAFLIFFSGCTSQATGNQSAAQPQNASPVQSQPVAKPVQALNSTAPQENKSALPISAINNSTAAPLNAANLTAQNNSIAQENASAAQQLEPEAIQLGNYTMVLEDLTLVTGENRQSCAVLDFYSNQTVLGKIVACPGQDSHWTAPDGHLFRIVVYQTAPGYSGSAAWAEIAVFG